jgi:hypothetical protein
MNTISVTEALADLHARFGKGTVEFITGPSGNVTGHIFTVGRSTHVAGFTIGADSFRLFADGIAYGISKAAQRKAERERVAALRLPRFHVLRYPRSWMVWDRHTKRAASGYLAHDSATARCAELNDEHDKAQREHRMVADYVAEGLGEF